MKIKTLFLSAMMLSAMEANAQISIGVDTSNPGFKVSPNLYGIFFEDINHAADGGLYAELIRNRSFEDNENAPDFWSPYNNGKLKLRSEIKEQLNGVQKHCLEVEFSGKETQGFSNEGFWGINAVQGRTYKLTFWAKGKLKGQLNAFLGDEKGERKYASATITEKISGKWTKYQVEFTSKENDKHARFFLTSEGKGKVSFDMISLFPPTFRNRENGLRPDLAQMLYNLHPKFMRFPGGCFVEGQNSPDNAFRWERTVGPIESRMGHQNVNWGYRTSDGMGFHEMLQLSEDLGAKPLYVVNVGLWHGGLTPVDSIQPWIDECMNALEYANGPVDSKYGAMRAKNGHPAPFNIEYLEIGNENNQPNPEAQSDHYYDRYKKFKDAILAKYPKMHLIGNVVAWGDDNPKWESSEDAELLDEHYYRNPAWFAENFRKYDFYERGKHDIYVGEYAVTQGFGKDGNLNAALGEAVYMMGIEDNSDVVKLASYAPIFANVKDRKWSPDMIQFDQTHAYGTPSYYVQKLMAENVGTRKLNVTMENPYSYELDGRAKVKPAVSQLGVATWATQATFRVTGLDGTDINPNTVDMSNLLTYDSGQWSMSGEEIKQTSNYNGAIAVGSPKITSDDYTLHLQARKDGGNEGFIVVFNYVDKNNYCWLNLGGWNNTQHGVEQVINGSKTQIATKPGKVETGKWYNVDLHIKGDSIIASLDGKKVFDCKLKPTVLEGVFSTASLDEKSGETIVKIVNTGGKASEAKVDFGKDVSEARVIRLSSKDGLDENNLENPTKVIPMEELLSPEGTKVIVTVPAYSLSIVRAK